jgi:proliferating cell nuclear antigen
LKLLSLDSETLGIPDTEYQAVVKMPASEFQRICKDLTILGDTVLIAATKEGVKFSVRGDLGNGNVTVRPTTEIDTKVQIVLDSIGDFKRRSVKIVLRL